MIMVNEEIEHVLFGKGKVISQDADKLSVQFSEQYGTKQFVYPDAFEKYLKLSDSDIAVGVLAELHAKQAMAEAEKNRKSQEYEAAVKIKALEKSAAVGPKRKSTLSNGAAKPRKSSPKKVIAKE